MLDRDLTAVPTLTLTRGYPPEFRRTVLDLIAAGRKVAYIARDFGVSDQAETYRAGPGGTEDFTDRVLSETSQAFGHPVMCEGETHDDQDESASDDVQSEVQDSGGGALVRDLDGA